MKPAKWPNPTWSVPTPYGYASAVDTASSVAAPLLAGFSVTLIVLVIDQADRIRWPDLALLLLASATSLLLVAIQAGFSARQYVISPGELEEWWPDLEAAERWKRQRAVQFGHAELMQIWIRRFRMAYNLGILCFLAALPVVLTPPSAIAGKEVEIGLTRAAAIAIAGLAVAAELLWIVVNALSVRYGRTRWEKQPIDARILGRFVLWLVPATREVAPPDVKANDLPEWVKASSGDPPPAGRAGEADAKTEGGRGT